MLKRFALVPSERLKECEHEHMRYRGAIPCTGPRVCSMCGAREDDLAKRDLAVGPRAGAGGSRP